MSSLISWLTERRGQLAVAVLIVMLSAVSRVGAQSGPSPLPTVPGAERATQGGLTQAHASLPGEPGKSPLEPYLILWLLPASGLLTVFAAIFVDRQVLALGRGRKAR